MKKSGERSDARAYGMPPDHALRKLEKLSVPPETLPELPSVEKIYSGLLYKSTRGTDVLSLKAPALSTEFVKSRYRNKAQAKVDGAFIAIDYPSHAEITRKNVAKHGHSDLFGYVSTAEADAYPAGYGERAATSTQKEDSVYQLKSVFTSAAMAMSKLRARIAARQGDPDVATRLFSQMWGLTMEEASMIPEMEVAGSEKTRMSAMEDRAYHSLNCHPAFAGGFRVDMASVTPDALGTEVPLNWARLRTGAKAVALVQMQGDLEVRELRNKLSDVHSTSLFMEVTYDSQPPYARPQEWEPLIARALDIHGGVDAEYPKADMSETMMKSYRDSKIEHLADFVCENVFGKWSNMSDLIRSKSRMALEKTIVMMELHQQGRSLIEDDEEDEINEFNQSQMGKVYHVPDFIVSKRSLTQVMAKQIVGKDDLPDMTSHGPGKKQFNMAEVRAAGMGRDFTIGTALNLAVFIATMKESNYMRAYALMREVKDPGSGEPGKVAVRLRNPKYFDSPKVRCLGKFLFDDSFIATLEAIIRNLVSPTGRVGRDAATEIWSYLSARCTQKNPCPSVGGISEMIEHLTDAHEGWTLYYWARISIGKWHYASQDGILAPIAAGEEVDLIKCFKKGIRERAKHWEGYYQSEYKDLYEEMRRAKKGADRELRRKMDSDETDGVRKYIPPHLRQHQHLEAIYEDHSESRMGGGSSGVDSKKKFERLAMVQIKKKFFHNIEIRSFDRVVSVGITDEGMREMLIESYQARWLSLDRSIKKAVEAKEPFYLGSTRIDEHPWGEIETDFPDSLSGVRQWMNCLDSVGWTVSPDTVWAKLSKSINEFWGDLSQELKKIADLVEESDIGPPDEIAFANLSGRSTRYSDTPTQVLPAYGFTAPYALPEKKTVIVTGETSHTANYSAATTYVPAKEEDYDSGADVDNEDFDLSLFGSSALGMITADIDTATMMGDVLTIREEDDDVLSYRRIADALGFEGFTDAKIRLAFGLNVDQDVDAKHYDASFGPVVRQCEIERVKRMWSNRMPIIKRRLGMDVVTEVDDDM